MTGSEPVRIVILGGGFAGISVAREAQKLAGKDGAIEVHLVNEENYFLFQPLLPEVVSGCIEPGHILNPIRQLCPGVHFHCATVANVDVGARTVTIMGTDDRIVHNLAFDHLIWCLGVKMDLSRVPGMSEHAYPIKTLGDAFHVRNRLLRCLEEAELEADEAVARKLLTVVTVGGGFSGVETAAEVNGLIQSVLPFYPRARRIGHRVVLVHSGERVLQELDPDLAEFAQDKLRERGVDLLVQTHATELSNAGVVLSNGEILAAATVICTVGNSPHPLVQRLALPQEKGRILVDDCFRVKGHQGLWALGDAALIPDVRRGGFCPPTAQYAMREGAHCARNVITAIRGGSLRPFRFRGIGELSVVGRRTGVGKLFGWKISGLLAWLLWRSVYLVKMPGLRCKVRVGIDWALDLLFPRDITMFEVGRTEHITRAHYREGETIIRQGEPGGRFFVIQSGQVEIIQGGPSFRERRLGTRSAGDSFGEIALIKNTPRTASVRCLTPVNVLVFDRAAFHAMLGSYRRFRSLMEIELAQLARKGEPASSEQDSSVA